MHVMYKLELIYSTLCETVSVHTSPDACTLSNPPL